MMHGPYPIYDKKNTQSPEDFFLSLDDLWQRMDSIA